MKIALTCPASLPATQFGGILSLCVDIARESANSGHDTTIFTTDLDFANDLKTFNKNLPRIETVEKFKIKRFSVWFSIGLFYVNPGIYFDMLKEKYDVIHTIGVRSFQSYAAALVSKKRNIPLIISDQGGLTTHPDLKNSGLIRQIFYKLQSPMVRFVIGQSKKIIVANEYEKKIFSELTDQNKIEIVENGINLEKMKSNVEFKTKYAIDHEYFLFLGRFHKVKGIDILLKAMHLIKNHHLMSDVRLVIMGVDFGFEDEMLKMINSMNLDNVVKVIKNPPREDVIAAYKESEFLVLPSRWELSPLTPLEGFAFKKPTISTKAHGIPYTLDDGKNSILVESENFNELGNKIIELLNDKTKCRELGMNGYEHIQKTCNSQEMVQHMLRIYEKAG